ncbi:MAG: hypothetical protein QOC95_213, partial [Thermoleophilaceae bacterium]|nr:hypothetical protein [Thermoleophilaceae bacterium]
PILHKVLHVHGGEGALPFFGLAMSMLAMTYLATQYHLALHRSRFLVVLAAGAVAQPLIMVAIGPDLTGLALGLLALHLCMAATMAVLALRRPAAGYEAIEEELTASGAVVEEPAPAGPTVA